MKDRTNKEQLIYDLEKLQKSRGWRFIVDEIRQSIDELQEAILDPLPETKEETLNEYRYKLKLQKNFINLPDRYIQDLNNEAVVGDQDVDVYQN